LLRSFNQIAKREREQREREQALKEREEKLRGLEPLAEALEKRDAWALLERMGYTYEDLTRDYISGNGPDPNRQVRDEIAQTKKQLEAQLAELRAEAERRRLEEERQYLRQTID